MVDPRRYDQFEAMAKIFDGSFDKRTITRYGCNCPHIGDRPLSDPGKGAPVDPLDRVCLTFKVNQLIALCNWKIGYQSRFSNARSARKSGSEKNAFQNSNDILTPNSKTDISTMCSAMMIEEAAIEVFYEV